VLQHITIYFKLHYTVMLILNGCLGLDSMPDDKILVLVLRALYQGLGHDLESWLPTVADPGHLVRGGAIYIIHIFSGNFRQLL